MISDFQVLLSSKAQKNSYLIILWSPLREICLGHKMFTYNTTGKHTQHRSITNSTRCPQSFRFVTLHTHTRTDIHHLASFNSLIEVCIKDSLYLFSLQFGTLYFLPEGSSSCSLWRMWFGPSAILRPCLLTVSSNISWREDGGCTLISFFSCSSNQILELCFQFNRQVTKLRCNTVSHDWLNWCSIK